VVGNQWPWAHAVFRALDRARHRSAVRTAVSPADTRQNRTLSSYAGSQRAASRQAVRVCALAGAAGRVPPAIQSAAAACRAGHATAGPSRPYRAQPQPWEYPSGSTVVRLNTQGCLDYDGRRWFVCEALRSKQVRLQRFEDRILVSYRHLYVRELHLSRGTSSSVVLKVREDER
jgi:hypothetical protein